MILHAPTDDNASSWFQTTLQTRRRTDGRDARIG